MIPEEREGACPFSHPIPVAGLDRARGSTLSLTAKEDVLAALAAWLGVVRVTHLGAELSLVAIGAEDWKVEGRARAEVVQTCVATLEPVVSRIEAEIDRHLSPHAPEPGEAAERELSAEDLDGPDRLGAEIDVAAIAAETVLLEIDPYPRAAETDGGHWMATPAGAEPLTDEAMRPFAKLAELKRKLQG